MLPHHKDWQFERTLRSINKLARDMKRGKLRGRTMEEVQEQIDTGRYGATLMEPLDHIDVKILSMKDQPNGEPHVEFAFRCLHCGGEKIRVPDEGETDRGCGCTSCGHVIADYETLRAALNFLAVYERRYGRPEDFPAA